MRIVLAVVALGFLGGCPKNVSQSVKTGKDGVAKGAKPVKLEENEGRAKGIVTYPGGDRVDWKMFEVAQKGDVEVNLKWKPPREGLDLSMNVLDDTMAVKDRAKPAKGSGKTRKKLELKNLDPGKYYVQIYASERGDAGAYTLDLKWMEPSGDDGGAVADSIPDPPRLPAVPPPVAADPAAAAGGAAGAPGGAAAGGAAAPGGAGAAGAGGAAGPTTAKAKPVKAKITEKSQSGSEVLVIVDAGGDAKVEKNWVGKIYKGTSNVFLTKAGHDLVVIKVSEDEATARVLKLSITELGENARVVLEPPPEGAEQ